MSLDPSLVAAWASVLAVVAGLAGVWWQLRKTSLLHSAEMVTTLADRFHSEAMSQPRIDFAALLEAHSRGNVVDLSGDVPILDFFENIGHLVRRRALDEQMVWNKFSWHLDRYYVALTLRGNLLEDLRRRESDPQLYVEFEWLCRQTLRTYRRLGVRVDDSQLKVAWLEQLFAQERQLLQPRVVCRTQQQSGNVQSTGDIARLGDEATGSRNCEPPN